MSLVDFESSRDLKQKRNEEKEMRTRILEKVKNKKLTEEWNEDQAKKRGENIWMLPTVSAKIDSKIRKHKKKKKKHDSLSNDSPEESEMKSELLHTDIISNEAVKRDEWMEMTSLFQTFSKDEIDIRNGSSRKLKALEEKKKKEEANKPGSHARELNPYFKNGGSGVPDTVTQSSLDASWLKRALERAQKQAKDEGRTLEQVAKDRWGSLEIFNKLLEEAENNDKKLPPLVKIRHGNIESKSKNVNENWKRENRSRARSISGDRNRGRRRTSSRSNDKRISCTNETRRRSHRNRSPSSDSDSRKLNSYTNRHRRTKHRSSSSSSSCEDRYKRRKRRSNRRNSSSSDCDRNVTGRMRKSIRMLRPASDDESKKEECAPMIRNSNTKTNMNWKKKSIDQNISDSKSVHSLPIVDAKPDLSPSPNIKESLHSCDEEDNRKNKSTKILTDKEMNKLAAKLTKAELMGNESVIDKLKKKLEKARSARDDQGKEMNSNEHNEEVVVLMRTDARGFIRPASSTHAAPQDKKSRKMKVATHGVDGERVRYFADDDNYDLKSMFEKEKLTSAEDQITMFHKGACSNTEKLSDDFDVDDMFMSKLAPKQNLASEQERDRKMAISEHQRTQKSLESCHRCIDSTLMKKHLIVSIGSKCYLSVPYHQSLTENHCLISPLQHVACSIQADEDLWQEINDYRQALVRMFESRNEDCVFFETAVNVKNHPHMVIECVPLPREIGDVAPIYFKKAILECEEEWAQNKKLIDLQGRNVRKAVPVGLPYFFVDFGMSPGYAHVIENETTFGKTFAQEIVGGMLDIDACDFRRPKPENFDKQKTKVMNFAKIFETFDIS